MAAQPISMDVITELDSDFEHLPAVSSPAPSSFSHITTTSNGDEDQSGLSDFENHTDNSDDEEVQEELAPLPPLTSFIPIIETLPGLVLEDNTYYVLDSISLSGRNVEPLISYARRVEELVLTDSGRDERPRVSQDTITRLAHVRDINNPSSPSLLSSLKRLRLINVDSELDYLWFCLTPSLQLLELSGISPARVNTTAAFFAELNNFAPQLAYLTLGPGRLLTGTLRLSPYLQHIRELRLNDVAEIIDFEFLQAVAALPELVLFNIDASTAEYIPYTPAAVDADAPEERDSGAPVLDNAEHAPAGAGTEEKSVPFLRLTTLAVTGNVVLMHDLLRRLIPCGVEQLSLTLVHVASLSIPAHWPTSSESVVEVRAAVEIVSEANVAAVPASIASSSADAVLASPAAGVVDESLPSEAPYHTFKYKERIKKCRGDRPLIHEHRCRECQEKRNLRLDTEKQERQKSNILLQGTHFASTIEHVLDYASPQSVHINCVVIANATHGPSELSQSTLRKLLSCPSLVKLQVDNWILTSINETLLDLPNASEQPLPMQILHIPVKEHLLSSIALSTLPLVARLYPHLLDFQVRLAECASAHARELGLCTSDHGLKELSFSAEGQGNIEDIMEIAPYIYFLFPHLERCRIAACDDQDAGGWKSVYGLFKMCQKVRNTEKKYWTLEA